MRPGDTSSSSSWSSVDQRRGVMNRLRRIKNLDREDVTELMWKWRCKFMPPNPPPLGRLPSLESVVDNQEVTVPLITTGKDPMFGAEVAIKTMYEGKNSEPGDYEWVDYPPKQLSKSAARAQDRVAIKVYKVKDRSKPSIGGRLPLRFYMLDIQSSTLKAILEPIMKDENFLIDVNESIEMYEPFVSLWFGQDGIHKRWKDMPPSDPGKPYLELLMRLMDEMFAELKQRERHLKASGLIDFKSAWILFPRGCTVYSRGLNGESVSKLEGTSNIWMNSKAFLRLDVRTLVFDGEQYVWKDKCLYIEKFDGNKLVRELEHFPLSYHASPEVVETRLLGRGKKVLDFLGLEYRCYDGLAIHMGEGGLEKHNVEGRVLIDVFGYDKYYLVKGSRETEGDKSRRPKSKPAVMETPEQLKPLRRRLNMEEQEKVRTEMLSKQDEIKFLSELIGGYSLTSKMWFQFYVEDIEPMAWNHTAFDHLVYDEQQKDLVLSFVESHRVHKHHSLSVNEAVLTAELPAEDVIRGKGQGLIVLLSGPPGTGKTLLSESVADYETVKRPLIYIHAEDLGINASSLGANIKRLFEMATDWNAIILLDEADVFMAERNPNDIHRNELVSIFLRELEYFRGIIFLTTNLYHTIDSAFRSRVSLHLLFESLRAPAREKIWRKFLDRLPDENAANATLDSDGDHEGASAERGSERKGRKLDDEDVRELALWQLNGREINNAVKMVRQWCEHKQYGMTLERLESGIKVTNPHATKDGDVDQDLYE